MAEIQANGRLITVQDLKGHSYLHLNVQGVGMSGVSKPNE